MKINIVKTTNIDLTDALTDYVEKKLSGLNQKFIDPNDESVQCDIELGKTTNHHRSGDIYRAEFNLHVAGKDLYAAAEEADLYAAVDEARDDLRRQLKTHRGKKETLFRKGGLKFKEMIRNLGGRSS